MSRSRVAANFDIDCLRTFLLVADSMSFSRAAESVSRSQSTVSQQINKLENQAGKSLLVRRKGRVLELTSEGGKLLDYARRILQLNDEAYSSLSDEALTGFVRLGVPLDFFGRSFTTWLAGFKAQHPMVGLEIESNQSENLFKRVKRSEFDLAFFKQENGASHGDAVLREQLVWVSGPKFAPSRGASVPLILFPEGCAYRKFAVRALEDSKLPWHLSFVSPSFECMRSAVIDGMGVTVLARGLVSSPMRIVGHGLRLPQLPAIELAYSYGRRTPPRVVTELANYLSEELIQAGSLPHLATSPGVAATA